MLSEEKIYKLVEERGVWPSPYQQGIKKLVSKIVYRFNSEKKPCTIKVPPFLLQFIKEVSDLELFVKFNLVDDNYDMWGSAGTDFSGEMKIDKNGKLPKVTVTINAGFNKNGDVFERTLYNNLCHEIHHILDIHKNLLDNNCDVFSSRITNNVFKRNSAINELSIYFHKKDANYADEIMQYLNNLMYRFFDYNELNALISGVYGDLCGMHSRRENFRNDIKQTQAYQIYQSSVFNINSYKNFIKALDDEETKKIYTVFRKNGYIMKSYNNTTTSLKQALLRTINERIKFLFNGIGKAASLYYDSEEEKNSLNELEKLRKKTLTLINYPTI